jgi:DNA modification methylase
LFGVDLMVESCLTRNRIKSSEEIMELFSRKEIDEDWSFEYLKPSDTNKWTHGYHRYPAKFIPQLVEKLLDEYITHKNAHINDPFMGSGTTIATSISRGFRASGTDINKIAYLIAKVKSMPIEPNYLDRKISEFIERLNDLEKVEPIMPEKNAERIDYWFREDIKMELGKILSIIYGEEDLDIRDFYLVAFSHILKNCSYWLQKSIKPTRDLRKKLPSPRELIRKHLIKMKKGNDEFYKVVPENVRENLREYLNIQIADARNQSVDDESVDLIISSSPYVTSYEYADLHQLSTIWLDLTDNLSEYKKEFIGTACKKREDRDLMSNIANNIVKEMANKNKKKAEEIKSYFLDMEEVFVESFRILKNGGRCCFVIGNTRILGVDILNAEVFAESLQCVGFEIDRIIKRRIPSKALPQKRDGKTGRFVSMQDASLDAYPVEYIVVGKKNVLLW